MAEAFGLLLVGVALAALGGEVFVRGTVAVARWARISPLVASLTVAAFSTSSPELAVGLNAAAAGRPEVSLGDALGSNVVNVALILGVALLLTGDRATPAPHRREFAVALLAPLATLALAADGALSRLDGLALLALFAGWLFALLADAGRQRAPDPPNAPDPPGERARPWAVLALCALGLALLLAAGAAVVAGARGLAAALGWDAFAVGATLVAVGTSTPELATALVASLRGRGELGLGTVLGSNLFNNLAIVGTVTVLSPIGAAPAGTAFALGLGLLALLAALPTRAGLVPRWRALPLLGVFAVFMAGIAPG